MESKNSRMKNIESKIKETFAQNGGKEITWNVKGHPSIKIKISRFVDEDLPEQFNFIYKVGNHIIYQYNGTDLSKIVSEVIKARDDIKPRRKRIHDLQDFYTQHIQGHTQEQWDLAKRVMYLADDNSGQNLEYVATSLQLPVRVVGDVMAFARNINRYASSYNEIYKANFYDRDCKKAPEENDKNIFGGVYSSEYDNEFKREHPNAVIRDRKKIYDEVDDAMHCAVIQDVPANLVDYPIANSERKYAVFYYPHIIPSGENSEQCYTLHANIPYYRLELPLSKVKRRTNRNFDLILDDRKEYYLDSGSRRGAWITSAYIIESTIYRYKFECDLNGEFPHPSVNLDDIENYIHKFEKQGESMVCVKVPYTKSSDGWGMIYRRTDCLFAGKNLGLRLDDNCTVHYYITDAEGRKIRRYDKCIPAEDIKASMELFQKERASKQNSGLENLFADCNEDLINFDLKNDRVLDDGEEWIY